MKNFNAIVLSAIAACFVASTSLPGQETEQKKPDTKVESKIQDENTAQEDTPQSDDDTSKQSEEDETKAKPVQVSDEDLKVIRDSRDVYIDEYLPLQREANEARKPFYKKMQLEQQFRQIVENSSEKTLDQTQAQIESLTTQLEALKRAREVLSHMDDEDKKKAIEESKQVSEQIQDQMNKAGKVLQTDISELQKAYQVESRDLSTILSPLFRLEGTDKFKEYKRRSLNANYPMAQVYATYYDKEKSYLSVNVRFMGNAKLPPKPEKIEGKFPIIRKNTRQLYFKIGELDVTVYASKKKFTEDELIVAAVELIRCDDLLKLQEK